VRGELLVDYCHESIDCLEVTPASGPRPITRPSPNGFPRRVRQWTWPGVPGRVGPIRRSPWRTVGIMSSRVGALEKYVKDIFGDIMGF
jgi:hypothetical protein